MQAISEILSAVEGLPSDKDRVAYLQNIQLRYREPIKIILKHMFDPNIKFLLPEGAPPYTTKDLEPTALFAEIRRFYLYVDGGHATLKQGRREHLFQQFLEALIPGDAELVLAMKDKKSPYKSLTKALVKKAFPDLY